MTVGLLISGGIKGAMMEASTRVMGMSVGKVACSIASLSIVSQKSSTCTSSETENSGQVGEAVQSQTLDVETHLELKSGRLDQSLSQQPAVFLSCDELRPPRLHQRLRLQVVPVLLSTRLNQDDLETVELLDEGQRFLKLSLALRNLQRAVQKLQSVLALDVLLSRTQGLVRIQQSLGLTKGKRKMLTCVIVGRQYGSHWPLLDCSAAPVLALASRALKTAFHQSAQRQNERISKTIINGPTELTPGKDLDSSRL
ncbi:hypothetical protein EYF80_024968 [Liparis tanakae]|uniref:Uncharacterized protein n=1 Tax=Liparis tanakae TaxID=230148 RepID=A0A4Z2HIK4_9TELE|nr:hypothetical protein EYF80_024968 [Liparis tanakae]